MLDWLKRMIAINTVMHLSLLQSGMVNSWKLYLSWQWQTLPKCHLRLQNTCTSLSMFYLILHTEMLAIAIFMLVHLETFTAGAEVINWLFSAILGFIYHQKFLPYVRLQSGEKLQDIFSHTSCQFTSCCSLDTHVCEKKLAIILKQWVPLTQTLDSAMPYITLRDLQISNPNPNHFAPH